MSFSPYRETGWWERTRAMRRIFLVGVVVGIIVGWMLHGVVTTIVRFGFVAVLLLPLLAVAWFWWRSSRQRQGVHHQQMMMQWTSRSGNGFTFGTPGPTMPRPTPTVIDIKQQRPEDQPR